MLGDTGRCVGRWGLGADFWPLDPLRCLAQHTVALCPEVGCDLTLTPVSPRGHLGE